MQERLLPSPSHQFNTMTEETAFKMQSLLTLPSSLVRFESPRLVYYLSSYSLHVMEFEDDFEEPIFRKFELPNVEGASTLTIDNVRVITLSGRDQIVVIAIGYEMYCWEVRNQRLLWRTDVVGRSEHVLKVSKAAVVNGTAYVGIVRGDGHGQIIEIRWMDRMVPPRIIYLGETPSLLKNISSTLFSYWIKQEQKLCQFAQCTLLKSSHDRLEVILIRDSLAEKYVIELVGDTRKVKLQSSVDFSKEHLPITNGVISNVSVELEATIAPAELIVFTIICNQSDNKTYLTRVYKSLVLGLIINSNYETVQLSNTEFTSTQFSTIWDKAYIMGTDKNNDSHLISFEKDQRLEGNLNAQKIRGRAVIVGRYLLTDSKVIEMSGGRRDRLEENVSVGTSRAPSEVEYRANINSLLQTTPKLASSISIYTDKYSDPIDMLDALRDKNQELVCYINQLRDQKKESYMSEVLLEKLGIDTQILLAENLKPIHDIISEVAKDRYPGLPMKIFETTSGLPQMLEGITTSNRWTLYIRVLKLINDFRDAYAQYYHLIERRVIDIYLLPLNRLIERQQIILPEDRVSSCELYSLAIELNPQQNVYYIQIIRAGDIDFCLDLAHHHRHYQIAPLLYCLTNKLTPNVVYGMLEGLDGHQRARVVCNIAFEYLRDLSQKGGVGGDSSITSGLKIFRDFPEYDESIYQVIRVPYPQFAWILAMKIGKPLQQYTDIIVRLGNTNKRETGKVLLNIAELVNGLALKPTNALI